MNNLTIWLVYAGTVALLALPTFLIPDKAKGFAKFVKSVASIFFVMVGITFLVVTAVMALEKVAPNIGTGSGSGDDQETCVPDLRGCQ